MKREVVEVIRGVSAFDSLLLVDLIAQSKERIAILDKRITDAKLRSAQRKEQEERLSDFFKGCRTDMSPDLSALDFSVRKKLFKQLASRVFIGRDGAYRIEWAFEGISQSGADAGR